VKVYVVEVRLHYVFNLTTVRMCVFSASQLVYFNPRERAVISVLSSMPGRWFRVFENRMLSRIFGPKGDEVTREWRKLHNEELNICTLHPILFG
jgi:hypothetical protein